jgi:pantoate--beta-alanine ligase
MVLFKKINDLAKYLAIARKKAQTIGFVPTMGALHAGHLSLIAASQWTNGISVASIFVNPTQFNDPKDYQKYPITIEKDITLLESVGCDALFLPAVAEIYPDGVELSQNFELNYLETILEGQYRPGHFQGVCKVMHRLLEIVKPDHLYMGQKDYQQCMVVKRLLQITGSAAHLHTCTTLREADGLAMSSRNMRLSSQERAIAPAIYEMLCHIKNQFSQSDFHGLHEYATQYLKSRGFGPVDYVAIARADDLSLQTKWNGKDRLVALVAAFLNDVRLIDNIVLN